MRCATRFQGTRMTSKEREVFCGLAQMWLIAIALLLFLDFWFEWWIFAR